MGNMALFIKMILLFVVMALGLYFTSYFLFLGEKERNGLFNFGEVSHEEVEHPKHMHWHFDGFAGKVDKNSAQRGLQVYREVCSSCHALNKIKFRNLADIGFSEAEIKALAAEYEYDFINDDGDVESRKGIPADGFPSAYPNVKAAAAANNGKAPPDLSLMYKARHDGGNYMYSLLTGYTGEEKEGLYENPYFPGHWIAMAKPLNDGQVEYQDGTEASVDQMSQDIVNFLQWAAEPEMEQRKKMGIKVMLFLAVFTFFFYIAKIRIWADVKK